MVKRSFWCEGVPVFVDDTYITCSGQSVEIPPPPNSGSTPPLQLQPSSAVLPNYPEFNSAQLIFTGQAQDAPVKIGKVEVYETLYRYYPKKGVFNLYNAKFIPLRQDWKNWIPMPFCIVKQQGSFFVQFRGKYKQTFFSNRNEVVFRIEGLRLVLRRKGNKVKLYTVRTFRACNANDYWEIGNPTEEYAWGEIIFSELFSFGRICFKGQMDPKPAPSPLERPPFIENKKVKVIVDADFRVIIGRATEPPPVEHGEWKRYACLLSWVIGTTEELAYCLWNESKGKGCSKEEAWSNYFADCDSHCYDCAQQLFYYKGKNYYELHRDLWGVPYYLHEELYCNHSPLTFLWGGQQYELYGFPYLEIAPFLVFKPIYSIREDRGWFNFDDQCEECCNDNCCYLKHIFYNTPIPRFRAEISWEEKASLETEIEKTERWRRITKMLHILTKINQENGIYTKRKIFEKEKFETNTNEILEADWQIFVWPENNSAENISPQIWVDVFEEEDGIYFPEGLEVPERTWRFAIHDAIYAFEKTTISTKFIPKAVEKIIRDPHFTAKEKAVLVSRLTAKEKTEVERYLFAKEKTVATIYFKALELTQTITSITVKEKTKIVTVFKAPERTKIDPRFAIKELTQRKHFVVFKALEKTIKVSYAIDDLPNYYNYYGISVEN